jgi:hypothetical protein
LIAELVGERPSLLLEYVLRRSTAIKRCRGTERFLFLLA